VPYSFVLSSVFLNIRAATYPSTLCAGAANKYQARHQCLVSSSVQPATIIDAANHTNSQMTGAVLLKKKYAGAIGVVSGSHKQRTVIIQLETNTSETPSRDYLHNSRSNNQIVQGTYSTVGQKKNKYAMLKNKLPRRFKDKKTPVDPFQTTGALLIQQSQKSSSNR